MRIIDADKLIEKLSLDNITFHYGDDYEMAEYVKENINQAPTVDLWHYPSKGEYPKEGEKVLILYENDGILDTCLGDYSYCEPADDESFKADFYWNKENLDPLDDRQVECWQYIIPPKEEA